MRLDHTPSITRILLAAVHTRNPFESRHSPEHVTHAPARTVDDDAERKRLVDEKVAQALAHARKESERLSGTAGRQDVVVVVKSHERRVRDAELDAQSMVYGLNAARGREATRDGEEAALFDSTAWSSSRMAAVNRLAVHTGSDSNVIAGQASSRQDGETTTFSFTGTVGQGVGRDPISEDARPTEASDSAYQGTNYRLTTGNGNDVLNMQLAATPDKEKDDTVARVANAQVFTGGGNDTVSLNAQGHDTSFLISAGSGDDTVTVTGNGRLGKVDGGSGNDRIVYAGTAETLQSVSVLGGDGDDTLVLSGNLWANITGGSGADTVDIRDLHGSAYLYDLSGDHLSANSDTLMTFYNVSGTTLVDMTGETQTAQIRFASLRRDQVDITSSGDSVTITQHGTGTSVTFNNVADNFTSQLWFQPPPAPPPPPEPPAPPAKPSSAPVTTVATQTSVQAGKAGGTAGSGGSLAGSGSIQSSATAGASSSGKASASASTKVVNAQGKPLELQSELQATAINIHA